MVSWVNDSKRDGNWDAFPLAVPRTQAANQPITCKSAAVGWLRLLLSRGRSKESDDQANERQEYTEMTHFVRGDARAAIIPLPLG